MITISYICVMCDSFNVYDMSNSCYFYDLITSCNIYVINTNTDIVYDMIASGNSSTA